MRSSAGAKLGSEVKPYYQDSQITILQGHVLDVLPSLPPNSVHCVVTSPPYWGLRDYGLPPQVWDDPNDANTKDCTHLSRGQDGRCHKCGHCDHEWVDHERWLHRGTVADSAQVGATKDSRAQITNAKTTSQSCKNCNAWRGSLGMEPTPDLYIQHIVQVFRQIWRVGRPDMTVWLNIADSYASGKGSCFNPGGGESSLGRERKAAGAHPLHRGNVSDLRKVGLKPKDLCGIPARTVLALQADGWWWRSDIIWQKPDPMPESVDGWRWEKHRIKVKTSVRADNKSQEAYGQHKQGAGTASRKEREAYFGRGVGGAKWKNCPGCAKCTPNDGLVLRKGSWRPTSSHEYVFFLAKSDKYFADGIAVREETTGNAHDRGHGVCPKSATKASGVKANVDFHSRVNRIVSSRNLRSVWTIPTQPFPKAHFATFPEALVLPCIQAGTSEKGCCPECGAPWVRVVEKGLTAHDGKTASQYKKGSTANRLALLRQAARERGEEYVNETKTIGWRPSCHCIGAECNTAGGKPVKQFPSDPIPCTVLDPFGGSGRTAIVAKKLGRNAIIIELKAEYCAMPLDQLAQKRMY